MRMASRQIQGGGEFVDRDQYHTEDVFRFFKLYGKLFRCVFAGNDQQVYRRCLFRRPPQAGVERCIHEVDFGIVVGGIQDHRSRF